MSTIKVLSLAMAGLAICHIQAFALMPPKQYDHPYNGPVEAHLVPYGKAWETCNKVSMANGYGPKDTGSKMVEGRKLYGCSYGGVLDGKRKCIVVYSYDGSDKLMKSNTYRHELGHCNGWGSDHKGGI